MHFGDTTYWRGLWIYWSCSKFPPARKIANHVRKLLTASKVASMRRRWWKTLWILCLEWRECKVRTNTTILVRQTRYRAKLCGSFGLSLYTWPICPNLKLRMYWQSVSWQTKRTTQFDSVSVSANQNCCISPNLEDCYHQCRNHLYLLHFFKKYCRAASDSCRSFYKQ